VYRTVVVRRDLLRGMVALVVLRPETSSVHLGKIVLRSLHVD